MTADLETIRQELIAQAEADHAQYPQYRNFWDGWVVATTARVLKHRGMQLPKGLHVLANPKALTAREEGEAQFARYPDRRMAVIYWPGYATNTSVIAAHLVAPEGGWDTTP